MSFPRFDFRAFCIRTCIALLLAGCAHSPWNAPAEKTIAEPQAQRNDPIAEIIIREAPEAAGEIAPKPQIFAGSGAFVGSSARQQASAAPTGDVDIDLTNASIQSAADTILGDILGVSYIVQEGLTGAITIRTSEPVSREAVLGIFESALRAKGAVLLEEDGVFRIAPIDAAYATPPSFAVGREPSGPGAGFSVQIVPLRYVAAAEMARILNPIAPDGAILRIDKTRNILVLGGAQRELQSLLDAIQLFDVDWMKGMSFALLPVRTAKPQEIANELTTIFSSGPDGQLEGMLTFVPNNRLNAVLVISSQPRYLDEAAKWAARLDSPDFDGGEQLFVYNVQNRPARELEDLLRGFLTGQASRRESEQSVAPRFSESLGGDNGDAIDIGGGEGVDPARQPGGAMLSASSFSSRGVRVIADEANNSLVIYASAPDYKRILSMLERLDSLPNQVMIEATIAEVTLTDELKYGLRWFFQNAESTFTFSDVSSGAVAQSFPGFSYLFADTDARVALNAISSITNVNVISSPTLFVMDNRTAELQVGDQVPVATQSAVSITTPDAPVVNTISFRDTGVILRITPRVNESGVVILDLDQEVSNVAATTTSGIDSPTIQQRRVHTTVAVQDGDSVALGGLIQDNININSSGVPFVSKIPLIGEAFKSKRNTKQRTELLILITPRIARNRAESAQVTEEFRSRLRSIELERTHGERP
jgi:general secretion pathway protein D